MVVGAVRLYSTHRSIPQGSISRTRKRHHLVALEGLQLFFEDPHPDDSTAGLKGKLTTEAYEEISLSIGWRLKKSLNALTSMGAARGTRS